MSAFAGVEDLAPPSVTEASAPAADSADLPSAQDLAAVASGEVDAPEPPSPEDVGLGTGSGAVATAELPPDPELAFG
ncbi:hypothetical protein BH23ACT6_BH23ACT6_19630 [soil metagenome]